MHQGGELGRFTLMDGVDPFAIEANKDDGKSNGDSDSYDQKDRQDDLIKVVTNGTAAAIGIMIAYHLRPFYMAEKSARVQMQQLCQAEAVKIILSSDNLTEITRAVSSRGCVCSTIQRRRNEDGRPVERSLLACWQQIQTSFFADCWIFLRLQDADASGST